MIVAGSLAWREPQRASLGLLAMAIGVTWLSVDWIGWADGPALVRTVVMVIAAFIVPLVAHLSAVFPSGRIGNPLARSLVTIAYGVTVLTTLAWRCSGTRSSIATAGTTARPTRSWCAPSRTWPGH